MNLDKILTDKQIELANSIGATYTKIEDSDSTARVIRRFKLGSNFSRAKALMVITEGTLNMVDCAILGYMSSQRYPYSASLDKYNSFKKIVKDIENCDGMSSRIKEVLDMMGGKYSDIVYTYADPSNSLSNSCEIIGIANEVEFRNKFYFAIGILTSDFVYNYIMTGEKPEDFGSIDFLTRYDIKHNTLRNFTSWRVFTKTQIDEIFGQQEYFSDYVSSLIKYRTSRVNYDIAERVVEDLIKAKLIKVGTVDAEIAKHEDSLVAADTDETVNLIDVIESKEYEKPNNIKIINTEKLRVETLVVYGSERKQFESIREYLSHYNVKSVEYIKKNFDHIIVKVTIIE